MLTTAELTAMRSTQQTTMTQTCTIKRDTITRNEYGGTVETPATVATVACRCAPSTAKERVRVGMTIEGAAWTITLPASTDVRVGDRLEIDGRALEVKHVIGGHTFETARQVLAVQR